MLLLFRRTCSRISVVREIHREEKQSERQSEKPSSEPNDNSSLSFRPRGDALRNALELKVVDQKRRSKLILSDVLEMI